MAESKNPTLKLPGINAAIIMDGNGRWAKKNALSVTSGHERGVEVVKKIVESAAKAKLESLSLYAFSTENWSRPKKEILGIKKLIIKAIDSQLSELIQQEVRLNFFGDYSSFGKTVIDAIFKAERSTAFEDPRLKLNIALGYGGRADIIQATKLIAQEIKLDKLSLEEVSDETIFKFLKAPISDLDLLIRTGGDQRISNFLLYHLAYSEIQFTDTLWPDFTEEEFLQCLEAFFNTERRFGKRTI
ncbi:MAG: di-trans,poly-cis-decaprenylcistransferase [SAR86 cluster bacterium]|jgi:undecaprenyl diphosphate synthase|uniref:Ditrans,polycis-undecaprenyl-diphosphate synthase ((2E,6E)-farnesyl-diphosphate specific) n=1 Tax=SAR86 cluster bacterium TaxID=2030880 RepID=A0A838XY43_9GAMM|nr:di-trans,poly-cis-decaprenylcistransferase [SAR86 cluster bacterium]|tara:strand:- start:115 stop:846 length:732 start_codon:yes stop_codon:yes gene_type:complete